MCSYLFTYICKYTFICIYICTCFLYTYIHIYRYIDTYIYLWIHLFTFRCIYIYLNWFARRISVVSTVSTAANIRYHKRTLTNSLRVIFIYVVVSVNFVGESYQLTWEWLSRCRNHGKLNEPICVSFAIGCEPSENMTFLWLKLHVETDSRLPGFVFFF